MPAQTRLSGSIRVPRRTPFRLLPCRRSRVRVPSSAPLKAPTNRGLLSSQEPLRSSSSCFPSDVHPAGLWRASRKRGPRKPSRPPGGLRCEPGGDQPNRTWRDQPTVVTLARLLRPLGARLAITTRSVKEHLSASRRRCLVQSTIPLVAALLPPGWRDDGTAGVFRTWRSSSTVWRRPGRAKRLRGDESCPKGLWRGFPACTRRRGSSFVSRRHRRTRPRSAHRRRATAECAHDRAMSGQSALRLPRRPSGCSVEPSVETPIQPRGGSARLHAAPTPAGLRWRLRRRRPPFPPGARAARGSSTSGSSRGRS